LAQELATKISAPPPGYNAGDFVTLDAGLWGPIFTLFAKKLTLAMHYRVLKQPLRASGGLVAMLSPNGHFDADWDRQIEAITVAGPLARHGGEDLSNQTTLRWAYDQATAMFCGRMTLHQTLIVYGFTSGDAALRAPTSSLSGLDGPFDWGQSLQTA
jgi:hypothetical protein